MNCIFAVQHLQKLWRVRIVSAQLPRPVPGPAGLRCAGRAGGAVDGAKHDLQFQLDRPAIDLAVQPLQQLHRPVEHRDRLGHRRARDRETRRLDVIADGLFGRAGAGEMLREDGRFRRDSLGKVAFEDRGDPGMEAAAIAQQQAFIGRILNQGVLEAVGGARRFADAEQQIRVDQLVERLAQGRRRPLGDGAEHAVGEFAADDGADLRQLARPGVAVETCHQRTVERRRNRHGLGAGRDLEAVAAIHDEFQLKHGLGQLLDEERDAVGADDDLAQQRRRHRLVAREMLHDRLTLRSRQAIDRQHLCISMIDQRRRLLRPIGDEQQQTARRDTAGDRLQKLQRRRIEPVRVLDHHQQRLQRADCRHLFPQNGERLLLAPRGSRRVRARPRISKGARRRRAPPRRRR